MIPAVDIPALLSYGPATPALLALVAFFGGCLNGSSGIGFATLVSVAMALLVDARTAVLLLSGMTPIVMAMPIYEHRQQLPGARRLLPMFLTMPLSLSLLLSALRSMMGCLCENTLAGACRPGCCRCPRRAVCAMPRDCGWQPGGYGIACGAAPACRMRHAVTSMAATADAVTTPRDERKLPFPWPV